MKRHINWINFYKYEIFAFLAVVNGVLLIAEKNVLLVILDAIGIFASIYLANKYLEEC